MPVPFPYKKKCFAGSHFNSITDMESLKPGLKIQQLMGVSLVPCVARCCVHAVGNRAYEALAVG